MKSLLILLLALSSLNLFAFTIKVDDWKHYQDMDRSFLLVTQSVSKTVRLDCQSFIQGLMFGEFEETEMIWMDTQSCQELSQRIQKSISKNMSHCLDVEEVVQKDYRCR